MLDGANIRLRIVGNDIEERGGPVLATFTTSTAYPTLDDTFRCFVEDVIDFGSTDEILAKLYPDKTKGTDEEKPEEPAHNESENPAPASIQEQADADYDEHMRREQYASIMSRLNSLTNAGLLPALAVEPIVAELLGLTPKAKFNTTAADEASYRYAVEHGEIEIV